MKLLDLITEGHKHDYGCVMLNFDFPLMNKIHDMIDPDDVYGVKGDDSYGLETEPHITILYGLHKNVSTEEIKDIIRQTTFDKCKIYNPSLFKNDEFDVLKYDVGYATRGGAFLHKLNRELRKLPHTTDFPEYNPHMTIAYLKKGTGERYSKALKNSEFILTPKQIQYSKTDGTKNIIPIKSR